MAMSPVITLYRMTFNCASWETCFLYIHRQSVFCTIFTVVLVISFNFHFSAHKKKKSWQIKLLFSLFKMQSHEAVKRQSKVIENNKK